VQYVGDVLAQTGDVITAAVDQDDEVIRLCRVPGYADFGGDSMTSSVPASERSA
jgi:hypothetical protein